MPDEIVVCLGRIPMRVGVEAVWPGIQIIADQLKHSFYFRLRGVHARGQAHGLATDCMLCEQDTQCNHAAEPPE